MRYLSFAVIIFFSNKTCAQLHEIPEMKIIAQPLIKTFPQAKLLFNTDKGKVYALPLDNMPCLAAIGADPKGVITININGIKKIPNALPEHKIIPDPVTPKILPKVYK